MPVLPRARTIQREISAIRRDIHAHPELAFEEKRTADLVASKLRDWGIDVTRGLGKTGVVGTLRAGRSRKSVGLRADMDALPIVEENDFAHRSRSHGCMHACGHDGHTAMLLGAAKILSESRNFEGNVHFIFQPAEEGKGGAKVMIEDGLFEKFPCNAVFAIHNRPGLPIGQIATTRGVILAAADTWDIRIRGKGGHAAAPHATLDPIVVGSNLVLSLQTIVSRNIDPIDASVVTVGFFHGGSTYNVIPGDVHLGGTTRTTRQENRLLIKQRIAAICSGMAKMHGVDIEVEHREGYPATVNHEDEARLAIDVATGICGRNAVNGDLPTHMGAEDFAFMLEKVPGALIWLGNGTDHAGLHNARYEFDDKALPFGVSYFVRTVERFLARRKR